MAGGRRRRRALVGGLVGLGVVLALAAAAALSVRHLVNDDAVPRARDLLPAAAPRRVMAVWAHPDDEVTSAGTLTALARSGAQVTLVYLTHGEAAHHTGYTREELWRLRPQEAQAAGRVIGARAVVLDYGDGRLASTPAGPVEADLRRLIAAERPSVVVSFDERVGFYGHPDHAQTGRWVAEVVRAGRAADPGFPVRRLYQATLPAGVIALARRHIAAFRDHYPAPPAPGLPAPAVAVPIAGEGGAKRAVLDAHRTQVKVIDDVQPFGRTLPPWLYYRLFDREYFAQAPL